MVQARQLICYVFPLRRAQAFGALFATLWRIEAHPDRARLRSGTPKVHIFLEVSRSRQHLGGDRPMNVDSSPGNVFENPLVRRGMAAYIVVLRQTIDGNRGREIGERHPFQGDGNDPARNHHGENTPARQSWQNLAELSMPDHRFAAYQRHVHRLVMVDEIEDAGHQVFPSLVSELSQG